MSRLPRDADASGLPDVLSVLHGRYADHLQPATSLAVQRPADCQDSRRGLAKANTFDPARARFARGSSDRPTSACSRSSGARSAPPVEPGRRPPSRERARESRPEPGGEAWLDHRRAILRGHQALPPPHLQALSLRLPREPHPPADRHCTDASWGPPELASRPASEPAGSPRPDVGGGLLVAACFAGISERMPSANLPPPRSGCASSGHIQ